MKTHKNVRKILLLTMFGVMGITPRVWADVVTENSHPDYLRSPLPEQWLYVPDHLQTSPSEDRWWKEFGDTTLNMLIAKAEANNYNVAAAMKRIELANKEMDITRAGYYPTLGASAGWTGSQQS